MKALDFNQFLSRIFLFFPAVFMLAAFLAAHSGYAGDKPPDTDTHNRAKNKKIHITADKLISDYKASHAEFIGNVTATQAETAQAVYNIETEVLTLSGDNSRIISGNDSISGEKITLYRTTGRINVESGSEKRVEAVFYSGEKGLK